MHNPCSSLTERTAKLWCPSFCCHYCSNCFHCWSWPRFCRLSKRDFLLATEELFWSDNNMSDDHCNESNWLNWSHQSASGSVSLLWFFDCRLKLFQSVVLDKIHQHSCQFCWHSNYSSMFIGQVLYAQQLWLNLSVQMQTYHEKASTLWYKGKLFNERMYALFHHGSGLLSQVFNLQLFLMAVNVLHYF